MRRDRCGEPVRAGRAIGVILFVTRKFPPSVGGMEKFSFELSRALARMMPVRLIAWGGAQTHLPLFAVRVLGEAARLRRQGTVVKGIYLGDAALSPLGLILKRVLGAPLTVTAHGLDVTYPRAFYQAMIPRALARADLVICDSVATQEACRSRGVAPEICPVIPCGVAPGPRLALAEPERRVEARAAFARRFGNLGTGPILLSAGRLVRRKGVARFVEDVLPRLHGQLPGATLLIVGEGPERRRIEAAAERVPRRGPVRLLGRLSDDELCFAYAAADCFVMPNQSIPGDPEGFGIAALDASVAGLWVFASRVDGIPDAVLDGINGCLLPPEDGAAWTYALSDALRDPLELRRQGGSGRETTLSTFGWPSIAARYAAAFASVGQVQ